MSANEKKELNEFRKDVNEQSDSLIDLLTLLSSSVGDIDKSGLHNISIIYNNKISELLHYYYDKETTFFTASLIGKAIHTYLTKLNSEGVQALLIYCKFNLRQVSDTLILARKDKDNLLGVYKEAVNRIYNYELKDIPVSLEWFLDGMLETDPLFMAIYLTEYVSFRTTTIIELKKLGLDYMIDDCVSLMDKYKDKYLEIASKEYKKTYSNR